MSAEISGGRIYHRNFRRKWIPLEFSAEMNTVGSSGGYLAAGIFVGCDWSSTGNFDRFFGPPKKSLSTTLFPTNIESARNGYFWRPRLHFRRKWPSEMAIFLVMLISSILDLLKSGPLNSIFFIHLPHINPSHDPFALMPLTRPHSSPLALLSAMTGGLGWERSTLGQD